MFIKKSRKLFITLHIEITNNYSNTKINFLFRNHEELRIFL